MKIHSKTLLLAAAAAVLGIACSKTENNIGPDAPRTVKIRVINDETRATGPHVPAQAVVFASGKLFFTTSAGTITRMISIDATNNAENGGMVGIGALKNGTLIQNVPGNSEKVYLLGNLSATLPPIAVGATNISVIEQFVLQVADLFDPTNKGVAKVPIYGAPGNVVPDGTDYKANLTVAPMGARMEIGQVTAEGNITSYKVEGIFMNYYYGRMQLNGAIINSADLKANDSDPSHYIPDAGGYTAALSERIYDYNAAGIGHLLAAGVYSPVSPADNSKVWGYNLLAPAGGTMPHIVVRLSGVTTNLPNDPYAGGTWFLTIGKFYSDPGVNATPITTLAARNVYRITNLKFNESDLGQQPEVTSKKVTVEVSVLPWISNDIGYNYN